MPDSKGELKRYQFDPTWEKWRGISPLIESSGGNLVKWIDYRAALSTAEQRIEELEKLLHEARFRHLLDHYSPTLNEWKKLVDKVLPLFVSQKEGR